MSYILDALKKSDRERKQGKVPDLQSIHGKRPDCGGGKKKVSGTMWLAGGVVAALVALLLYWGFSRRNLAMEEKISALEKRVVQMKDQPPVAPPAVATTPPDEPLPEREPARQSEAHPAPEVAREPALPPPTVAPEEPPVPPAPRPVAAEQTVVRPENLPRKLPPPQKTARHEDPPPPGETGVAAELPLFEDLPEATQKGLSPLKLAGHVYASDPARRMVVINNRICREGDVVDKQLVLEQIVWEGVVLRNGDVRFRMNHL